VSRPIIPQLMIVHKADVRLWSAQLCINFMQLSLELRAKMQGHCYTSSYRPFAGLRWYKVSAEADLCPPACGES
jgi:hypothetical protein